MNNKKRLELEKILSLAENFFVCPSPDGRIISFLSNRSGVVECYLYSTSDGTTNQLSHGQFPKTPHDFPTWSRDSKWILFQKDEIPGNEKTDILKINIETQELVKLTNTPEHRDAFCSVNNKNDQIAFFSDRSGTYQIYTMDMNGTNVIQLTNLHGSFFGYTRIIAPFLIYSPDDTTIYFSANETKNTSNSDIYSVDIQTKVMTKVLSLKEGSTDIVHDISPDGSFLLISSDVSGSDQSGILYLDSKSIKWFGEPLLNQKASFLTKNGKYAIVHRNSNAERKVVVYDINSGKELITDFASGYNASFFPLGLENTILVIFTDSTHKSDIYTLNLDSSEKKLVIGTDYGEYNPDTDFYPDEYVSYPSTGNTTIHAILYKPKILEPGKKYPALIDIHGGPRAQYMRNFSDFDQVLVDNNFITLKPNNRGSTGYGSAFRDACLGDWGGKDLEDTEAGVNFLKSLDYVDSERIGIYGGSYGGYMTYFALTKKPKLFKAGSAIVGISDLLLAREETKKTFPNIAQFLDIQMGIPDNDETIALWKERSAINFVHN